LPDQQLAGYRKRVDWIQRYISGSELASIAEIHQSLARATQLSAIHSESFRHALCGDVVAVAGGFFQNLDRVRQLGFDERFQRMWDFLSWVGCEGAFRERYTTVAQLFVREDRNAHAIFGDVFETWYRGGRAASR